MAALDAVSNAMADRRRCEGQGPVGTQGVRALDVRVPLGSDHAIATRLLPQPEQTDLPGQSRTACCLTGMCEPVHTQVLPASLRCRAQTKESASMPRPKLQITYATWRKGSRRPPAPLLDTASKTVASEPARPFIPPPTREQLMAGSANLRRVYKLED